MGDAGRSTSPSRPKSAGAGVLQPGRRPAPRLLVLRGRAVVPPGGRARSRTAPWPTGAWRWRTSTTRSARKEFIAEARQAQDGAHRARDDVHRRRRGLSSKPTTTRRKSASEAYAKALEKHPLQASPTTSRPRRSSRCSSGTTASNGMPITSYLAVDALLTAGLRGRADAPGHHYRIHLWDAERGREGPRLAPPCAGSVARASPTCGTCRGTSIRKLKRYADAAWQQEASARVDHAHMMRDRVLPDQIHNYAHNNEWLIRDLIYVGRVHDAIDLAKNMIELPRHPKYNTLGKGSANFGRDRLFEVLARFELWDELIALCQTPYLEPTDVEDGAGQAAAAPGGRLLPQRATCRRGQSARRPRKHLLDNSKADRKRMPRPKPKEGQGRQAGRQSDRKGQERREKSCRAEDQQPRQGRGRAARAPGGRIHGLQRRTGAAEKAGGVDPDYLAWVQFKAGEHDKPLKPPRKRRSREAITKRSIAAPHGWSGCNGRPEKRTMRTSLRKAPRNLARRSTSTCRSSPGSRPIAKELDSRGLAESSSRSRPTRRAAAARFARPVPLASLARARLDACTIAGGDASRSAIITASRSSCLLSRPRLLALRQAVAGVWPTAKDFAEAGISTDRHQHRRPAGSQEARRRLSGRRVPLPARRRTQTLESSRPTAVTTISRSSRCTAPSSSTVTASSAGRTSATSPLWTPHSF